jgi:hypothetical protein
MSGITMTTKQVFTSVPGILRPFKEYLQSIGILEGDQITYYGCAGTCTPFVELLAFAIRGLKLRQVFVPLLDETKARTVYDVPNVGMQASGEPAVCSPRVVVFMGGLAMTGVPVTKEQVRDLLARHPGVKVIGVCFMSMFEKAGWPGTVPFDLVIDATIDPVTVTRMDG